MTNKEFVYYDLVGLQANIKKSLALLDCVDSDRAVYGWPKHNVFIRHMGGHDVSGQPLSMATFFHHQVTPDWIQYVIRKHLGYGIPEVVRVTPEMVQRERETLQDSLERVDAALAKVPSKPE